MQKLLKRMKPTGFNDIVAALALYRPGPMGVDAHWEYADRKNGRKPIVPIHPELEEALHEILEETYGLIVYQEQIMKISRRSRTTPRAKQMASARQWVRRSRKCWKRNSSPSNRA